MKNELPQKRLSSAFQIVIANYNPQYDDISSEDEKKIIDILAKDLPRSEILKLRFEPFGIGRGASIGAMGIDLTQLLELVIKAKDVVDIARLSVKLTNNIKKKFGSKRTIVYSSKFIEHFCMGKILNKFPEQELKTILFKDITGGGSQQYEYTDYYLFMFSSNDIYYTVIVDSSTRIYECSRIIRYQGVKEIKL